MKTILVIATILISVEAQSQNNQIDSVYHSGWIKIQLPFSFNKAHYNYTEGDYFSYTFKDTSVIVVHSGYMTVIPHLRGVNYEVKDSTLNDRAGFRKSDNLRWREINIKHGLNIFFDNVKPDKQIYFDNLLLDIKTQLENSL